MQSVMRLRCICMTRSRRKYEKKTFKKRKVGEFKVRNDIVSFLFLPMRCVFAGITDRFLKTLQQVCVFFSFCVLIFLLISLPIFNPFFSSIHLIPFPFHSLHLTKNLPGDNVPKHAL